MKTLNFIGCGSVGRVLGALWHRCGSPAIGGILNRSMESAEAAAAFMETGRAASSIAELSPADGWLIGVNDDAIAAVAENLVESGLLRSGDIVFHCSGAYSSAVLEPARIRGAYTASAHPVLSFADSDSALSRYSGSYCAIEGHPDAVGALSSLFSSIGAVPFSVAAEHKLLYHAATVLVCGHLTALLEEGLKLLDAAGLRRPLSLQIIEPLVRRTIENLFREGTANALSGPIARGDAELTEKHLASLAEKGGSVRELYRLLGQTALELAQSENSLPDAAREKLERLLE